MCDRCEDLDDAMENHPEEFCIMCGCEIDPDDGQEMCFDCYSEGFDD